MHLPQLSAGFPHHANAGFPQSRKCRPRDAHIVLADCDGPAARLCVRRVQRRPRGHRQHPRLRNRQHAEDAQADARLRAVPAPGGVELPVSRGEGLILRRGAGQVQLRCNTQCGPFRPARPGRPCWHSGRCGLTGCVSAAGVHAAKLHAALQAARPACGAGLRPRRAPLHPVTALAPSLATRPQPAGPAAPPHPEQRQLLAQPGLSTAGRPVGGNGPPRVCRRIPVKLHLHPRCANCLALHAEQIQRSTVHRRLVGRLRRYTCPAHGKGRGGCSAAGWRAQAATAALLGHMHRARCTPQMGRALDIMRKEALAYSTAHRSQRWEFCRSLCAYKGFALTIIHEQLEDG